MDGSVACAGKTAAGARATKLLGRLRSSRNTVRLLVAQRSNFYPLFFEGEDGVAKGGEEGLLGLFLLEVGKLAPEEGLAKGTAGSAADPHFN